MTRATATRLLVERLTHEVLVSNLGQATLDLQRLGDRPLNCYTFGSMGQCSSIGLGIALARRDVPAREECITAPRRLARPVPCLDYVVTGCFRESRQISTTIAIEPTTNSA